MELTLEQIIALLQQGADAAPAAQIHSQVDVDFELVIEYIADDSMNPEVVLLSCRALVYGLSRMLIDGHFPEWCPQGDPLHWMRQSVDHFIRDLRP